MQTFLKTVLPYVFCILAGYLAGAVNFAWLLAKKRGFDIRTKGSGNAGTTNAGRTMGSGVAAVVFLCDALKSALMVWLAGFLFHSSPSIQTVTMAACVAGHLYPFYLEFQGGKGIAVLLGSALALDWRLFLIRVAGVAVITFITDYMVIGTLSARENASSGSPAVTGSGSPPYSMSATARLSKCLSESSSAVPVVMASSG